MPNPALYPNASIETKDPTQTAFTFSKTTTRVASIYSPLAAGTTYNCRVRFSNGPNGASAYSQTAVITTPTPVLSASANGTGSVNLEISGTTSPCFMIYRSTDGINFSYVRYTGSTTYTDGGLVSGQTYHYYVKSWNGGIPSAIATATAF
jgi:hypothetical protein